MLALHGNFYHRPRKTHEVALASGDAQLREAGMTYLVSKRRSILPSQRVRGWTQLFSKRCPADGPLSAVKSGSLDKVTSGPLQASQHIST